MRMRLADVRVSYHGQDYRVVLGPPYYTERGEGVLLGSGLPTINLADPQTGELRYGLTVEIPEAPLKPSQILVGGREEGVRALTEAGVVRPTGEFYRSDSYGATLAVCELLVRSNEEYVVPARPNISRVGHLLSDPPRPKKGDKARGYDHDPGR